METLREMNGLVSNPLARSLVYLLVFALIVKLVMSFVRRLVHDKVADSDVRYRASKLTHVAGYALVIAVALAELGGRLSGLTVALGAASAGIAFALQEVIVSFAGWLAVAFGGFYRVGDRVQLGGIKGDVIDIGFIRTTIMEIGGWVNGDLYNGRIVRVANSFIFKEPVFNYSGEFPFVWDEIVVPIKYGSSYELARSLLTEAAETIAGEYRAGARERWQHLVKHYRVEDASIDPLVTMVANDNWVEFTVRYVVEHRARRTTKDRLFSRILSEIDASAGKIGMASMTVHLVEAPRLNVSLDQGQSHAR